MKFKIIMIIIFISILSIISYYTARCLNNMYIPSTYHIELGEIIK